MSTVALGRKASSSGGTLSIDAVAERDLSCSSRNERRMKVSGQSHSSLLYLSLAQDTLRMSFGTEGSEQLRFLPLVGLRVPRFTLTTEAGRTNGTRMYLSYKVSR